MNVFERPGTTRNRGYGLAKGTQPVARVVEQSTPLSNIRPSLLAEEAEVTSSCSILNLLGPHNLWSVLLHETKNKYS
jgi:hypothetical protein